jgi:hypothetical protein
MLKAAYFLLKSIVFICRQNGVRPDDHYSTLVRIASYYKAAAFTG